MSSILPSKNSTNSERLSDLNAKVRSTCVDHDVVFVDNDINFTFRNGAVDDAAFQRDGIHLSESGTDRLLRNLDLPKQAVRRKQRLPPHRQVAMSSSARNSQANNAGGSPALPDNAWKVVSRQNRQRHSLGKCGKCGERNHVTTVCKHVSKVRCRMCGELGHKEKHHTCDKRLGQYELATDLLSNFRTVHRIITRPSSSETQFKKTINVICLLLLI